jgi:hypothetical protein
MIGGNSLLRLHNHRVPYLTGKGVVNRWYFYIGREIKIIKTE